MPSIHTRRLVIGSDGSTQLIEAPRKIVSETYEYEATRIRSAIESLAFLLIIANDSHLTCTKSTACKLFKVSATLPKAVGELPAARSFGFDGT
jgi:hypothetical protein